MLKISLLGSTGSVGTQVLSVVRRYPERYKVVSLAANKNGKLFLEQVKEFKPSAASLTSKESFEQIKDALPKGTEYYIGGDALESAVLSECDLVFSAVVGFAGLKSVLKGINLKKNIALANKETLVAGGGLVMRLAKEKGVKVIPVDSEHSALWQCLDFNWDKPFKKLILTASGGPFLWTDKRELEKVTPEMALKHPNWVMGSKITIDCSTMMNKGLEVIEARWLFDAPLSKIDTLVHPQSVIHSMVEFEDGSVLAQMSPKTMEIPIQTALTYPQRLDATAGSLDFIKLSKLEFFELDKEKFPCFSLALKSLEAGGNVPCAMSSANEEAVGLFLEGKIGYLEIPEYISFAMDKIVRTKELSYENLAMTNDEAKRIVLTKFNRR